VKTLQIGSLGPRGGELGRIQEYKIGRGWRGRGEGVENRIQET